MQGANKKVVNYKLAINVLKFADPCCKYWKYSPFLLARPALASDWPTIQS